MSIEGILEADQLRDYLYGKMRGARGENSTDQESETEESDEALVLLTEIRDSMRKLAESGGDR